MKALYILLLSMILVIVTTTAKIKKDDGVDISKLLQEIDDENKRIEKRKRETYDPELEAYKNTIKQRIMDNAVNGQYRGNLFNV